MTILVRHPRSYPRERSYVLRVVLAEFLGVEFEAVAEDRRDVEIAAAEPDQGVLRMPDIVFGQPDEHWPDCIALPNDVVEFGEPWAGDVLRRPTVPVLYGQPGPSGAFLERDRGRLYLGIDVLGTAFVLLSRLEELHIATRDTHGRFPAAASLASRYGFLDRPLVDEYCELLRAALEHVLPGVAAARPGYAIDPSHDIDFVDSRAVGALGTLRSSARDLVRERAPLLAARRAASVALRPLLGSRADVFNTFDELMECSERQGVRSTFFFISGRAPGGIDDDNYEIEEPWVVDTMRGIVERGHRIGLHGSYGSSTSGDQLARERVALEAALSGQVASTHHDLGCRQHFLRLDTPTTWRAQERAGLDYDATSGYPDAPGFRSGTCREHGLYDLGERRSLRLRERPLVVMDATLLDPNYLGLGREEALMTAEHLARECRRVGGTFTVLWHNTRLLTPTHRALYREILAC